MEKKRVAYRCQSCKNCCELTQKSKVANPEKCIYEVFECVEWKEIKQHDINEGEG